MNGPLCDFATYELRINLLCLLLFDASSRFSLIQKYHSQSHNLENVCDWGKVENID